MKSSAQPDSLIDLATRLLFGKSTDDELQALPNGAASATNPGGTDLDQANFDGSKLAAGKLNFLSLDKMRNRLGAEWPRYAKAIYEITEDVIKRNLSKRDIFCKVDEENYLIVFAGLSDKNARLKCAIIADEIEHKLLRKDGAYEGFTIKTVVASLDGKIEINELDRGKIWQRIGSLLDDVEASQDATESAMDMDRKADPFPGDLPVATRAEQMKHPGINWAFRPIWNIETKLVSTFRCSPFWHSSDGEICFGDTPELADGTEVDLDDLDVQTLAESAKAIHQLLTKKEQGYVTVPVRFSTMEQKSSRGAYLDFCRSIPNKIRSFLVFELMEIHPQSTQKSIRQVVDILYSYGRSVVGKVDFGTTDMTNLKETGITIIGTDISNLDLSEKEIIERLDFFASTAEKLGVKTYLSGAHSMSLLAAAACNGFTYLESKDIQSTLSEPRGAFPLDVASMYEHRLSSTARGTSRSPETVSLNDTAKA